MHQLLTRFLEEPGSHALLRANDFVVEDVGPNFLRLVDTSREKIVGHNFFEALPGHGDTSRTILQEAMQEAFSTGQPVKLATIRYDLLGPDDSQTECWWKTTVVPIKQDGEDFLVLRVEDETRFCQVLRAIHLQRINNYVLYGLVVIVIGIMGVVVTVRTEDNHQTAKDTCVQVQQVKLSLYTTVQRQAQTLGRPGTALYKFYQHNPGILQEVRAETTKELQVFKPRTCV